MAAAAKTELAQRVASIEASSFASIATHASLYFLWTWSSCSQFVLLFLDSNLQTLTQVCGQDFAPAVFTRFLPAGFRRKKVGLLALIVDGGDGGGGGGAYMGDWIVGLLVRSK